LPVIQLMYKGFSLYRNIGAMSVEKQVKQENLESNQMVKRSNDHDLKFTMLTFSSLALTLKIPALYYCLEI